MYAFLREVIIIKKIINSTIVLGFILSLFIPILGQEQVKAASINYGIVNFKTKACNLNTNYIEYYTGKGGYTNGCSAPDAAFLGYNGDGSYVKFKLAGTVGWAPTNEVQLYNMEELYGKGKVFNSYYIAAGGTIDHYINQNISSPSYSGITIGRNSIGLREGVAYLSYDGHYFYEDNLQSFKNMINDYKNNTYSHAVNASSPYYSYYQYLSHRTISNYTVHDIYHNLVNYVLPKYPNSKLIGTEGAFIEYQNTYGINALMMYSLAKHESASGSSLIAQQKNNLFGHAAYDQTPGSSANGYANSSLSVYVHAKRFLSEGYLDICDGATAAYGYDGGICNKGRYFGANYGNKEAGVNVKYASDPYWGEKAAGAYFQFDKIYGYQDFNKYRIGIKQTIDNTSIKSEPRTGSYTLYQTGSVYDYPFVIIGEVTGDTVNGSNRWYKVQSDTTIDQNRMKLTQMKGEYDFNRDYGYIPVSTVNYMVNPQVSIPVESPQNYTITFNANGGKLANGKDTDSIQVQTNTLPSQGNPTRDGYEFTGWDSSISPATANKTYTAQWKKIIKKYEITFKSGDGKFSDGNTEKKVTVEENTKPTMESPERNGYVFTGWDKEITNASENTTYTATWKASVFYDITFDANDGNFTDGKKTNIVKTAEGFVPSVEIPIKDGYLFNGWDKEVVKATSNTTYIATWKEGTIEDFLTKKDGTFYFSHLKEVDGMLQLEGYQTIKGIDNTLSTPIKYEVVYENVETGKEIRKVATRITSKDDIPKAVYSPDGKDYTYSWFHADIDLDALPNGNYKMYLIAYTKDTYSKSIINNKTYNKQTTTYEATKQKAVISNNYNSSASFVELRVRDELLAKKDGSFIYNQYDKFTKFEFKDLNSLYLRGVSYSYGMDLNKNTSVSRKIIFENKDTYRKFTKDLGSITDGNYDVVLPVSDSLDKTKAWYDKVIDISDIPVGTYVIYTTTTANVTDISEMTEKLGRSLDSVKTTVNGKTYNFTVNKDSGNRIEMIVK